MRVTLITNLRPGLAWFIVSIIVATRSALLVARRAFTWTIDEHLSGRSPECVAVDLRGPTRVYCGTAHAGLFRSRDAGRNREPVGPGIAHPMVTAVDVGHAEQADGFGVVYAGTELSSMFRADTGGDSWVDLAGLREPRQLAPGVFPHGPTRIMFGGSKPVAEPRVRQKSVFVAVRKCVNIGANGVR